MRACQALLGLGFFHRILIVINILLIVDNGIVDIGGFINNVDGDIFADAFAFIIKLDAVLLGFANIRQIALNRGESDGCRE